MHELHLFLFVLFAILKQKKKEKIHYAYAHNFLTYFRIDKHCAKIFKAAHYGGK